MVGVCGPNDAGKSTLCLVAAGLAPGSIGGTLEGSVLIGGVDARELAAVRAAERCGILFQNAATQLTGTTATVWEEIAFGPRNLGLDAGRDHRAGRVGDAAWPGSSDLAEPTARSAVRRPGPAGRPGRASWPCGRPS